MLNIRKYFSHPDNRTRFDMVVGKRNERTMTTEGPAKITALDRAFKDGTDWSVTTVWQGYWLRLWLKLQMRS